MQHKFLLRFIKKELEKAQVPFTNNEEFLKLFLNDEPWESYRSNLSNWLSTDKPDGNIRKRIFLDAIAEKLNFETDLWGASEGTQKEAVRRGVQSFKIALKEVSLFPWVEKSTLSDEQKDFLMLAQNSSIKEIKKQSIQVPQLFKRFFQNQNFLIELFNKLYERGEYTFIYKEIFPLLLDSYDNHIRAKKAHIYASLATPMYREAFEILNAMKGESKTEIADLKTSAISNIRRERFTDSSLSKKELEGLLQTLIGCYAQVYLPKQEASYYAGINLAYMLALAKTIFPNNPPVFTSGYSIAQIYQDVQKSIVKAKDSGNEQEVYYASMSELEFKLLLNPENKHKELEHLLQEINPSFTLVHQTQRQMKTFFLDVIKKFSDKESNETLAFTKILSIFDAYAQSKIQ